jgi:hypothetical protein
METERQRDMCHLLSLVYNNICKFELHQECCSNDEFVKEGSLFVLYFYSVCHIEICQTMSPLATLFVLLESPQ